MTDRQLRCPACDAPMQEVKRRDVLIDICRDCRGVFLDRDELDKLLDAVTTSPPDGDEAPPKDRGHGPDRGHGGERGGRGRRGSWLSDMFDFG